jgi:hypothetical protein
VPKALHGCRVFLYGLARIMEELRFPKLNRKLNQQKYLFNRKNDRFNSKSKGDWDY